MPWKSHWEIWPLLSILESNHNVGDPGWIPGLGRSAGEGIGYPLQCSWASLVAQLVKNLPQCRRPGFDTWIWKTPWRREWLPTPVLWPGEFRGLCSPWGHKELTTTEQLSLSILLELWTVFNLKNNIMNTMLYRYYSDIGDHLCWQRDQLEVCSRVWLAVHQTHFSSSWAHN